MKLLVLGIGFLVFEMRDDSQRVGVASRQREGRIRFADRVEAHLF
jgi:hypothetical protein